MSYNSDYHYWQYFLSLENDLIIASRYIEFTDIDKPNSNNAQLKSFELRRIFFSACAECENISKILADITEGNIGEIGKKIINNPEYVGLSNREILCPAYNLIFSPWEKWSEIINLNCENNQEYCGNPEWWWKPSNEEVQDNQSINYEKANLLNTLTAVAGLMCLLFSKMQTPSSEEGTTYQVILPPSLAPKLFIPEKSCLGMGYENWVWKE